MDDKKMMPLPDSSLDIPVDAEIIPLPEPDIDVFEKEFRPVGPAGRALAHLSHGSYFVAQGGLQAANLHMLSKAFFSGQLPEGLERMVYQDGLTSTILKVGGKGRMVEHQGFYQGNARMQYANVVSGIMTVASMVVGQYYLANINNALTQITKKLDAIHEKVSELIYLQQDEMGAKLFSTRIFLSRIQQEIPTMHSEAALTAIASQLLVNQQHMDEIRFKCSRFEQRYNREMTSRKERLEKIGEHHFYLANLVCANVYYSGLRVVEAALNNSDEFNALVVRDLESRRKSDRKTIARQLKTLNYNHHDIMGKVLEDIRNERKRKKPVDKAAAPEDALSELAGSIDAQMIEETTAACCQTLEKMSAVRKGLVVHDGKIYLPNASTFDDEKKEG